jgi:hypothetical protein
MAKVYLLEKFQVITIFYVTGKHFVVSAALFGKAGLPESSYHFYLA